MDIEPCQLGVLLAIAKQPVSREQAGRNYAVDQNSQKEMPNCPTPRIAGEETWSLEISLGFGLEWELSLQGLVLKLMSYKMQCKFHLNICLKIRESEKNLKVIKPWVVPSMDFAYI